MIKFLNRIFTKVHQNGIEPSHSRFEIEKIVAFNWQIFVCIVACTGFIIVGIAYEFCVLSYFSASYIVIFCISFYCIHKKRHDLARHFYLFVTNYSVFSISYCLGYEAGFYFYFFTSPLTVFITYDNYKRVYIYLALLIYLSNAIFMNVLYHLGYLADPGILTEMGYTIVFNLNLLIAFFMIFMLVNSMVQVNKLKTIEAEKLYLKQMLLEAEIHQKQLNETRVQFEYKKLESDYKQLDMFSHIISHNLRGPISRVSGILELLKPFPHTSKEQEQLMGHLNSSVLMIDDIIKDLNHILVQKKLGQESINYISLDEVLQEVKLHLSEEIKISRATIQENIIVEKIPCVKGIMISIFYNLLSNSIKYAIPNQRPVIGIFAVKTENELMLRVKDEGIGFDSDKYGDKLFRLYNRFHNHVAGKGMGLFLVKSHIDMLGGRIQVESAPRKGTTFIIHLPLRENNFPSTIFSTAESSNAEDLLS